MSVPSTSTSSSTTQPPFLVGDAGKSVLPAIQAMTLPSVTGTSTSQYSAETLLNILERPSTSLSQVMDTPDPEVILPGELRTVATRLCDPLAVTLPVHHSAPLEPPIVPMKHQPVLVPSKSHLFPTSLRHHMKRSPPNTELLKFSIHRPICSVIEVNESL